MNNKKVKTIRRVVKKQKMVMVQEFKDIINSCSFIQRITIAWLILWRIY